MNVKAQGLLNAAKYVEDTFGRDALAAVLAGCSDAVRNSYTSSIAINWHPVEELCEFCEVSQRLLGLGHPRLVEDIGEAGAHANMKGMLLRIAFYWGKPEFLMKRAAGLWRQFNDEGSMELHEFHENLVRLEVTGVKQPRVTFCRILTGWCRAVALEIGVMNANAHHVECRANGDARCMWEVRGVYDPTKMKRMPT